MEKKEELIKQIESDYNFLVMQLRLFNSPECVLILNSKKNAKYFKPYVEKLFTDDLVYKGTKKEIKIESYYTE